MSRHLTSIALFLFVGSATANEVTITKIEPGKRTIRRERDDPVIVPEAVRKITVKGGGATVTYDLDRVLMVRSDNTEVRLPAFVVGDKLSATKRRGRIVLRIPERIKDLYPAFAEKKAKDEQAKREAEAKAEAKAMAQAAQTVLVLDTEAKRNAFAALGEQDRSLLIRAGALVASEEHVQVLDDPNGRNSEGDLNRRALRLLIQQLQFFDRAQVRTFLVGVGDHCRAAQFLEAARTPKEKREEVTILFVLVWLDDWEQAQQFTEIAKVVRQSGISALPRGWEDRVLANKKLFGLE